MPWEDLKLYYEFLDQIEMTDVMQENLAGNIVYFCGLMGNKWYRPLFLEFITYIKNKGFLTNERPLISLESAFVSWESFAYHDDRRISSLMESYLAATYERKYAQADIDWEEEKDRLEATALSYEWYMCQYGPEHPEEIVYLEENYPYTYADNAEFFRKLKKNAADVEKKIEKKLCRYMKQKVSAKEMKESLYSSYRRACANTKEPMYVYNGA